MLKRHLSWSGILYTALVTAIATITISGCVQNTTGEQSTTSTKASSKNAAVVATSVAKQNIELLSTDCIKCHKDQPAAIKSDGGRHKTEVSCRDCHEEHLPSGEDTIPECSKCHDADERDHFGVPNCLECHKNPHTPLNITIADSEESVTVCLTCHGEKGEELKTFPSMHTQQNCTMCHPARHKAINKCFTCHEGHDESQVYEDCLKCHKPHSPLNITYAADTPSKLCGFCHTEVYENLTNNPSKHGQFNCAFCHKDKHPTVPKCTDCHASIHDESLLSKFPDCLKCHVDPHDLTI
ncbi:MAG: hypothetical protein OEM02_03305 [Desulfobulbaceae bacterium]|nr:hypothetical protein [Desulfobulbaceae bacterium]